MTPSVLCKDVRAAASAMKGIAGAADFATIWRALSSMKMRALARQVDLRHPEPSRLSVYA